MTTLLAFIALSLTPTMTPAPPVVCVASDAASWRQAVQLSWTRDVLIQLTTTLPYTGNPWDYSIGRTGGTLEIVGGTLDLAGRVEAGAANGLTLRGARVTLRGVGVQNVQLHGSAIRADVTDAAEFIGCALTDIGTTVLTQTASAPRYTNGIGIFSTPRRITVTGCTFSRVALNDEQLAHVLYVKASASIVCTGNRYYGCGSVWGCYSPRTVIVGEYADFGQTPDVWDRWQLEMVHPWALVNNGGNLTFVGNTLRGRLRYVFLGNEPVGVVQGNVYDVQTDCWFFRWNVGPVTREAWAARGFDRATVVEAK